MPGDSEVHRTVKGSTTWNLPLKRRKQYLIITPALAFAVSLYERRHTPSQILLGFLRNPRAQNLQGKNFSSGEWDFPPEKFSRPRRTLNRTPSRGQRKNIKISRSAAKSCRPLFRRRDNAHAFPRESERPDCAERVWCCNSGYTAAPSEQGRVCW